MVSEILVEGVHYMYLFRYQFLNGIEVRKLHGVLFFCTTIRQSHSEKHELSLIFQVLKWNSDIRGSNIEPTVV